uniref:Uncharacterized protein n=1 Tax=Oryza nivara TaxID=4536 RepID=A0A0E0IA73_ORYNI
MRWEIDRAINRIPLLRFLPPQWQLRLRLSSTSGFPQSPFDPLTLASPRLGESDSEHSQPDRSEFHGLNHGGTGRGEGRLSLSHTHTEDVTQTAISQAH